MIGPSREPMSSRKRIAVVQSNYIPWKGFFDLIAAVDEFILYDDVQYTRRDWRNRNQIKTVHGLKWLTIPLNIKGRYLAAIKDMIVADRAWAARHWKMIVHNYGRASCFDEIADWLRTNGSFDDAIFYVVRAPTMALAARAKSRTPEMLVMARVNAPEEAINVERTFRSFGSLPPEVIHVRYPFLGPFRPVVSGSHRFKVLADSWVLPLVSVPWLRVSGVDLIESNDPIAVSRLF